MDGTKASEEYQWWCQSHKISWMVPEIDKIENIMDGTRDLGIS